MTKERSGIAIIGMACLFPGAHDLETFRSNLERGVDAITDAPPARLDPSYYDPTSSANDRIYCRRGGFLGEFINFNPAPFGIMPVAAEGSEPDQLLTLQLVDTALKDAGCDLQGNFPHETTSVILGRGGNPGIRGSQASQHGIFAQQLIQSVAALLPYLTKDQLSALKRDFTSQLGHYGSDTAIGLVPNIAASLVANRLNLRGPAYTIDAACASSLIAVDHAVRELDSRRADLVIAGGMHLCDDLSFWNVFSRIGAISRSHQIRPFDRRADGLLIGEGIGILVLVRQEDAKRYGDRIYATIRATGTSSDGRGKSLLQPNSKGQLVAMERTWREARMDPTTIGLLEAHGTGTPDGDRTELESIARFFGRSFKLRPRLGSVKSMIGHTMPAAGAAGLIKAALSLYHGFLPPTLHCEEPSELVDNTGFQLITECEAWPKGLPRRAAVNAFGFGGINGHVVLDAVPQLPYEHLGYTGPQAPKILLIAADSPEQILKCLESGSGESKIGPYRLAIENPNAERKKLAAQLVHRGKRWTGRSGIWYSPIGFAQQGGLIAFVFPGVDGRFDPHIGSLASYFRKAPPPYHDARDDIRTVPIGIISLGRWLTEILEFLGIRPHSLAGHSVGEWTGMVVSGIVTDNESDHFIEQVVPALRVEMPGVAFGAAGCCLEEAQAAIGDLPNISISHDNCPHQIILCGTDPSIDIALDRLRGRGVLCDKLAFRSGFHSPLLKPYLKPFLDQFLSFSHGSPTIPLWSSTTLKLYPSSTHALRRLFIDHLLERVRFRELTARLYDSGHRVFIQVGMGRLVGFIDDTLSNLPHVAVSALVEGRNGLQQLRRLATQLWCEGYSVNLEKIGLKSLQGVDQQESPSGIRLYLSTVRAQLRPKSQAILHTGSIHSETTSLDPEEKIEQASNPVLRELDEFNSALSAMSRDIISAWQRSVSQLAITIQPPHHNLEPRHLTRQAHYSLSEMPEIIDHCFMHQPKEWEILVDRFPVIPLTRSIDTLLELANELVPERVPIMVERIRAIRWIEIEPPVDLVLKADFDGVDRVNVSIGEYLTGTVVLAQAYPPALAPIPFHIASGQEPHITAREHYQERWAFHGPAYQGLIEIGPMTDRGIHGVISCLPARGALLDAAGQLAGYWCTAHTEKDRLALPYRIDRIRYFGPHPAPGTHFEANVHVQELTEVWARFDVEIFRENTLWARIEGLEDRRFQSDQNFFRVWQFPGSNSAAILRSHGYCIVNESWSTSASRYFIARLYLNSDELKEYHAKPIRSQRAWLLGRIAIKDIVRNLLWEQGANNIFPKEVRVINNSAGRPIVSGPWREDLRVSVAHKEYIAVAIAAVGANIGIDLETIGVRDRAFEQASFHDAELALFPERDRDEWITRAWVAKEAVAKSLGTGLQGSPRSLILSRIEGERLMIAGVWVITRRDGDQIIGWTDHPQIWQPKVTPKQV